jgi:hypothetical protein
MNHIEELAKKSSRKQIPKLFKKIDWRSGTRNFDIGGGKYDTASNWLRDEHNVTNLVQDVFNRSPEHNCKSWRIATNEGVDTITLANVLNVIPSKNDRHTVLAYAYGVFKRNKNKPTVYISCYNASGQPSVSDCQTCMKLEEYIPEIQSVFNDCYVKRVQDMIVIKFEQHGQIDLFHG